MNVRPDNAARAHAPWRSHGRFRLALLGALLPFAGAGVGAGEFAVPAEQDGWNQVRFSEGVRVYTKAFPGSPVYGLRSDGIINAPIDKVASIILDHARATEWVDRLVEERVVRQYSPYDYLEYNHFNLPFPFTDRDYLTRVKLSVDPAGQSLTLTSESVEDPQQPVERNIRGDLRSAYLLTSQDDGTRTRLQVIYLMDPRGRVPAFVVNLFQKDWPVKTYRGIRQQVLRGDLRRPLPFAPVLDALALGVRAQVELPPLPDAAPP